MVRLFGVLLSAAFLTESAFADSNTHKKPSSASEHHKKPVKTETNGKPHHKPSYHKPLPYDEDDDGMFPENPRGVVGDLNTFYFFADWGHPDNVVYQRQIAFAMEQVSQFVPKGRPDFIIAGGDNFYNAGVRNTTDIRWELAWNQVYTYPSQRVPFYAVLGNHDYYFEGPGAPGSIEGTAVGAITGSPEVQIQFYQQNALANRVNEANAGFITGRNRWILPDRHYTRKWRIGNSGKTAEFFYFDSVVISNEAGGVTGGLNSPSSANYTGTAELAWLENALRTSTADWKIPVAHYTIFSPSTVHGDNPDLILPLVPMFRKYGVKFYINGHDHIMAAVEYNGIKYYTNGAGGKSLYGEKFPYRPFYTEAKLLFSIQTYGFLQFTFSHDAEKLKLIVHKAGNTTGPLTQYFPGQPGAVAWTDIVYLKDHKGQEGYAYDDDKDYAYTATTDGKFEPKINSENPVQYKDPRDYEHMEVDETEEYKEHNENIRKEQEEQAEEKRSSRRNRRVMGRTLNAQA